MYGRFQKARLRVEAQRLGQPPPVPAARPTPVSARDHELAVAGYQRRIAELEAALASGGSPPAEGPSMADMEAAIGRIGELEALLAEERAKNAQSGSHTEGDSNDGSENKRETDDSAGPSDGAGATGGSDDAADEAGSGAVPAGDDGRPAGSKPKGARKGK